MKELHKALPMRVLGGGSVRTQLVLWNVAALALLLALLGLALRYAVRATVIASVDSQLDAHLRPFGNRPPPPPRRSHDDPDNRPPPNPPPNDFPGPPRRNDDPFLPRRFGLDGQSVEQFGTRSLWDVVGFRQAKMGTPVYRTTWVQGQPYRVLSRLFPDQGPPQGVVQVAYPLSDINQALVGLDRALLTLLPVAVLCAGLGGAILTGRVLLRVQRLTQTAAGIGAKDFSRRLPVVGDDEFSALAATFNGLLDRLETAYRQQTLVVEQQRRFTADASHELKTPLTIIQGNASLALGGPPSLTAYQQSIEEIQEASKNMATLVRDLLTIAGSDSGFAGKDRIVLLLSEVLERAVARVIRPGIAPIRLHVLDTNMCIDANEEEIIRVFANLLDNAVAATPLSGSISVTTTSMDDRVNIAVSDTGCGMAPEHLAHLGERFYRTDTGRARKDGGTGLGLAICRSIVEAHAGTLQFQSTLGEGFTATVSLPVHRSGLQHRH